MAEEEDLSEVEKCLDASNTKYEERKSQIQQLTQLDNSSLNKFIFHPHRLLCPISRINHSSLGWLRTYLLQQILGSLWIRPLAHPSRTYSLPRYS